MVDNRNGEERVKNPKVGGDKIGIGEVKRLPRVSLHMTVFNTRKYLAAAVQSVLTQTYRDFDLVLWDDGSTDGSVQILAKLARIDPRIRVIFGKHAGVAAAHAHAIAASQGEYIGWVDSDDLLAPTALAETVAALDSAPDAGMVYTDYYDVDEAAAHKKLGGRCKIPFSVNGMLVNFMTFHFRLLRRSVFTAVGGMDVANQCGAEDYDLCLRMAERAGVIHVSKPLYSYRSRPGSFSHERRMDQINASAAAVRRAIERRGLANTLELAVEVSAIFRLRAKNASASDSRTLQPSNPAEPPRTKSSGVGSAMNIEIGRSRKRASGSSASSKS